MSAAFRFSYDAFYKFYTARTDDASLFERADGAVGAYLYSAKRHRNGLISEFVTKNVTTVRRVKSDPMGHAHGLYFMCLASDPRRWLWWVFPEPCANRATGATEPYLVGNHLSFVYDKNLAEKQVRLHTTSYVVNENEDPDVVHVHDPFDDGAAVSASGPAAAFVKKNRARAPLIMDVLRRPFVAALSRLGGARKPGKKKRRAAQSRQLPLASVEGPPMPVAAPAQPQRISYPIATRSSAPFGIGREHTAASSARAATAAATATAPAASARAALVAACNRAFGGLDGFTAIGVRQADGTWTHSVELQWRLADSLKPPTYIVRARAAGSITFERAFARLLNEGPTLSERLQEHEYTSH
jgi:hypothetical protein